MKDKILVVGSLNMDLTVKLNHIPKIGETILANSLEFNCGGKGANQAYACAKLGSDVVMLGCVGDDSYGKILIENLSSIGVDTSRILKTAKNTGMAFINVDNEGNNNIVVSSGANMDCSIDYIENNIDVFDECKYVLLQFEIPLLTIKRIIEIACDKGVKVILNPAPVPSNINSLLYKGIDYITPNEHELNSLVKEGESMKEKVSILLNSVKNVVVTLGDKGVYFSNSNELIIKSAFEVKSIDTVAAGDCFNGAFVHALALGKNYNDALEFASGAAAISVTRSGAQSSIPSFEEVNSFLRNRR